MTATLNLDLHALVRIRAERLPQQAHHVIAGRMQEFLAAPVAVPEIVVAPGVPGEAGAGARQMDALMGVWADTRQAEPTAVFLHKGAPEIALILGEPIRIVFRADATIGRRLHRAMRFAVQFALARRGGLLCHGAVVGRGSDSLLLLGRRGARKTLLTLALLERGWDYLTDNAAILCDGRLLPFHGPRLDLRHHHFRALPWLAPRVPGHRRVTRHADLRNRLRILMQRLVPKRLFPSEDRFLNPSLPVEVGRLFPDRRILATAVPNTLAHIRPGAAFSIERCQRGQLLRDLVLLQEIAFADFMAVVRLMELYWPSHGGIDLAGIADRNIAADRFLRVSLPDEMSPDDATERLFACSPPA